MCSSGNHYRCREWLFSRNTAVLISLMIYCCIYLHHSISGALDGYIWSCCSWFSVQRSIPLWSYRVEVYRHFLHLPYAKPQSLWSAVEVFLQSPWKWQLPVPDILQLCLSAMDERRRTSFQETTHCESKEDRSEIFVWQVRPRTDGCFEYTQQEAEREVIYEMFHILNCGFEIKEAMIIAVMNAI